LDELPCDELSHNESFGAMQGRLAFTIIQIASTGP
jgi:hypothetical protein